MNNQNTDNVTFQVTVTQLALSSPLHKDEKKDICVTITIGDKSRITCSGELSDNGLMVTWKHPFLFSALPSTPIKVAIHTLPELKPGWDKQPLGDPMIMSVASSLESGNEWQCNVPGLSNGSGTLFMVFDLSDALNIPDGHDCVDALEKYDFELYEFGMQLKNMPCWHTKVQVDSTLLDLCPLGHENHARFLHNLGVAFYCQFDQEGNISDLNRAIEIHQIELDLCPMGHSGHAAALISLAMSLKRLFEIQRNKADLNRAIEMQERVLYLRPQGHSYHQMALGGLALSLFEKYKIQGHMADLNRAINLEEKRLGLCMPGDLFYGESLHSLAVYLSTHYEKQGNLIDLSKAIDLHEKALEFRPPNHPGHGNTLYNLAQCLKAHFIATNAFADLIKAIWLLKKSMASYPFQDYMFARVAGTLADIMLLLFEEQQSFPLQDEAFEAYRQLKKCGPAVSSDLLEAAQAWINDAKYYNHASILEAYQLIFNTLDLFTSLNASLDSRHLTMQARVANLPNDAFTCALRLGDSKMAVELLEQGRGILWNQLAQFDISLAELESQSERGWELQNKFTQLSTDLRAHTQGNGGEPYWRVQEQWQSVVNEIRALDGFSHFLLPPFFEDLQRAAELGPVIIVNAGQETSNALIVLRSESPVHVTLPCSFTDVDQLCSQLSELTSDAHAYGENRESYVKEFLRDLWSTVVEPIATVLRDDIQLSLGSRIWWCPTSTFTRLPLHAAGPHRQAKKNMFDLYVSSYAPSLSALLRAQDRVRSQRAARNASEAVNPISFAAIGQGRPNAITKLGALPEVDRELYEIQNETGMPPDVVAFNTVTGEAATIKGAVEAFRDHRWVHLACHGAQHADKPFESWFAMGDGKLTLMRILQERHTHSEFAFLSACHTAVGDASTPDEVLHLAAGMQFSGFNGVIGTLWRVDDAVAHEVVTEFYKEMFKQPVVGFEHAAAALNAAVVKTAGQVSLEKRIVFVHIGI